MTAMHEIELTDQAGQPWRLADALQQSAVVLVFYRGDW
jgi:peroxiredoxin